MLHSRGNDRLEARGQLCAQVSPRSLTQASLPILCVFEELKHISHSQRPGLETTVGQVLFRNPIPTLYLSVRWGHFARGGTCYTGGLEPGVCFLGPWEGCEEAFCFPFNLLRGREYGQVSSGDQRDRSHSSPPLFVLCLQVLASEVK
jgi:hypothetical protein